MLCRKKAYSIQIIKYIYLIHMSFRRVDGQHLGGEKRGCLRKNFGIPGALPRANFQPFKDRALKIPIRKHKFQSIE
jgi:hypothetical protein